jgi:uncharacterized protein
MKKLILSTCCLIIMSTSLQAATCDGTNLFKQLQTSNPQAAAEISKEAAAKPNQGPLFWKITTPKTKKVSYLLGTAHVTDERIATLSDEVKAKVSKSSVLLLELRETANRDGMSRMVMEDKEHTEMPEGQSVWDLVADESEDTIKSNPAFANAPPEILSHLQPWLIAAAISQPICELQSKQNNFTLDEALAQRAQIASVEIQGLETVQEQISVFANMPLEDQAAMLNKQMALGIPAEDSFKTLTDLYTERSVTVFEPLMIYLAKQKGIEQDARDLAFNVNFIDNRNANTASRAQPYIDKGGAFIAVGAAHLAGAKGVVQRLKDAGYKVSPAE